MNRIRSHLPPDALVRPVRRAVPATVKAVYQYARPGESPSSLVLVVQTAGGDLVGAPLATAGEADDLIRKLTAARSNLWPNA